MLRLILNGMRVLREALNKLEASQALRIKATMTPIAKIKANLSGAGY